MEPDPPCRETAFYASRLNSWNVRTGCNNLWMETEATLFPEKTACEDTKKADMTTTMKLKNILRQQKCLPSTDATVPVPLINAHSLGLRIGTLLHSSPNPWVCPEWLFLLIPKTCLSASHFERPFHF